MPGSRRPLSTRYVADWLDYVHAEEPQTGSYATREMRESHLRRFVNAIYDSGYDRPRPHNLNRRHIDAALTRWADDGLSRRTIDNRLSTLRWLSRQLGKPNVMLRTNDAYPMIPRRDPVDFTDKARRLDRGDLDKVRDPHVRMSLILQHEFGLRRKEAIMIKVHEADRGGYLRLEETWTKGKRERDVPIVTDSQRQALEDAKALAPPGKALIPNDKTFAQQRWMYTAEAQRAGLSRLHGLRHAYAQDRYEALTRQLDPAGQGWTCPARGGPAMDDLDDTEAHIDQQARLQLSDEMGHGRLRITFVYLGK